MDGSEERVMLFGGLTVHAAALHLLVQLEDRGLASTRDGTALVVTPPHLLTRADCRAIRQWKLDSLALVDYALPASAARPH